MRAQLNDANAALLQRERHLHGDEDDEDDDRLSVLQAGLKRHCFMAFTPDSLVMAAGVAPAWAVRPTVLQTGPDLYRTTPPRLPEGVGS
jgi:hypothetical protein